MVCCFIITKKCINSLYSYGTRKRFPIYSCRDLLRPFLNPFLLPSWRAVRSYWPHLEERDLIWGDDWWHSPFIRRSPSWGFLGVSSAVRQMSGDLCTAPRIIITLIISDRRDWRDARGKWPLARNPDRSWWHHHTSLKLFWPQPMASWTTELLKI